MNWIDRVTADAALSPRAHQVARIIVERFATAHDGYASFYDVDIGAFVDLSSGDIRGLRYQLQNAGYLRPLQSGNCKPSYRLCHGHVLADSNDDGGEAA